VNFSADKPWPLILFYHGTGGAPETGLIRHAICDRDYIVVGMEYSGPEAEVLTGAGIDRELATIPKLRELLGKQVPLDNRTLIGGFSLGGWTTERLARKGFATMAGAMIMGAGQLPLAVAEAQGSGPANEPTAKFPVYVGIGQVDTNHTYSVLATDDYRARGHPVTFDEFLGRSHQGPRESEYLAQWLIVQRTGPGAGLSELAGHWFDAKLSAAAGKEPVVHLLFLEHMTGAPFAGFLTKADKQRLNDLIATARRHPSFRAHLKSEEAYRSVLDHERRFTRANELIAVAEQYRRVWAADKTGHYGLRAALDIVRLRNNLRVLTESLAKDHAVELPAFPSSPVAEHALLEHFSALDQQLNTWRPPLP
jgi:predicted esterase